jgi:hypothetical protein
LIIAAVFASAVLAGPATAQVASPLPAPNAPDTTAVEAAPTADAAPVQPVSVSAVPEPGSVLLLGGPAAIGWVLYWRRKWRAPQPPTT